VVSLQFCAPLKRMKGIERRRRPYRASDLRGATLVMSATNDPALNQRVAQDAKAQGILVNVVDQPDLCSFIVPATVRRGRLLVTVSTGGASPALAAQIRRRLSRQLGMEYSRLLEALNVARAEAMRKIPDPRLRRRVLQQLVSPRFLRLAKKSPASVVRREMLEFVRSFTR
jgi:precorrin-2 dehydrogenase/sirohydrochlorin ferrochelatase